VIGTLGEVYPEIEENKEHICAALDDEETRFQRTLQRGESEFHKAVEELEAHGKAEMPGPLVFHLYDTYGFPPELTEELAQQEGLSTDMEGYRQAFREHQERSRQSVTSRFRGGLAEQSAETVKLHTATHLLQEALRRVLGTHVEQRGSNITPERLRFDFTHPQKLSDEELAAVERMVNEQIEQDLAVTWEEMSVDEALAEGAIGLFGERYGERVRVYSIDGFSKEICGGPHVERTGQLGHFRIVKQESVGAGVRRIRAVLEDEPAQR
jgi:alanyl-tRNA synthetase